MIEFNSYPWQALSFFWHSVADTSPFWVPLVLIGMSIWLWFYYIRAKWLNKKDWVLLEVRLPKQIDKTPQAMEVALTVLYQTRDHGNLLIDSWIKGEVRTWFSLELVSYSGDIHFYIRADRFFKNLVEAQFYAQYPDIEIFEVEDYVNSIPYGLEGSSWDVWGCDYKLADDDALPIKTYVDYGLDKIVDEENKVDPMTNLLEYLGTVGPGQQVWIQIMVMAAKDRFKSEGKLFGKEGWKEQGQKIIDKHMRRDQKRNNGADEKPNFGELQLSPGEKSTLIGIERNLDKLGFDCGIRSLYFYEDGKMDDINKVSLAYAFRTYAAPGANEIKIDDATKFKYPWQDPFGTRTRRKQNKFFDAYRRRSWFYPPYSKTPFVLSSEELATIYHFPGQVAATPTISKIESKRAVPPDNLPI